MKKREYKIILRELRNELAISKENYRLAKLEVDDRPRLLDELRAERDIWRNKYQELLNTPEHKADVESAFNRGIDFSTAKFRAWFLDTANKLNDVVRSSDNTKEQ